jgi:hypothetical protein
VRYDQSGMPAPAPIRISKSKFVAGIQCLKRLYFQVHQPELAEEADEGQESRLEQGPGSLRAQRKVLAQPNTPDISPGPQCTDPYPCEFFSHCNPELPEHHISFLPRLSARKKEALVELGVSLIAEIPEDFELTEVQARVHTSVTTGRTWLSDQIQEELSHLRYALPGGATPLSIHDTAPGGSAAVSSATFPGFSGRLSW